MRINNRVVIDIETGRVLERASEEYSGPLTLAFSIGGKSGKSSSSSKTKFPKKFFNEAEAKFGEAPTYNPQYVKSTAAYSPQYTGFDTSTYKPEFSGFNDFNRLEENLYGGQESKLRTAYDAAQRMLDERLSQSGLLTSPNQYVRGGASQALSQDFITNLQQAARDAALGRLGAEEREMARKTEFSTSTEGARAALAAAEAARKTGFSTETQSKLADLAAAESARETGFNVDTAKQLYSEWLSKLSLAAQAGRQSKSSSSDSGFNFSFLRG